MPPLHNIGKATTKEVEVTLQKLMSNVQETFDRLNQQNSKVENEHRNLNDRLSEAEDQLPSSAFTGPEGISALIFPVEEKPIVRHDGYQDNDPAETTTKAKTDIKTRAEELEEELDQSQIMFPNIFHDYQMMQADLVKFWKESKENARRVKVLESELKLRSLDFKQQQINSDQILEARLMIAKDLVDPIKKRLERAEQEKTILFKLVKTCREHIVRLENDNTTSKQHDDNGSQDSQESVLERQTTDEAYTSTATAWLATEDENCLESETVEEVFDTAEWVVPLENYQEVDVEEMCHTPDWSLPLDNNQEKVGQKMISEIEWVIPLNKRIEDPVLDRNGMFEV